MKTSGKSKTMVSDKPAKYGAEIKAPGEPKTGLIKIPVQAHERAVTARVVMDGAGRILVPAKVRKALAIEAGQALSLSIADGAIRLDKIQAAIDKLQHTARTKRTSTGSVVDQFIAERRAAAAEER